MRNLVFGIVVLLSSVVAAKAAAPVAVAQKEDIRVLGRLNVNCATREQLLTVPGIDTTTVDAMLQQRHGGPILDLTPFSLPAEAAEHLKTEGESDYRRIRRLPLKVLQFIKTAAR